MKPFFLLLSAFLFAILILFFMDHQWNYRLSATIAMSAMLLFTSLGHFIYTKGMTLMIPPVIPYRSQLIYVTGFLEIGAAIGILIPQYRNTIGLLLIIFFILLLPANIYSSFKRLNYETGKYDGKGLSYLWFRIPFQIFLIIWTYLFIVRH